MKNLDTSPNTQNILYETISRGHKITMTQIDDNEYIISYPNSPRTYTKNQFRNHIKYILKSMKKYTTPQPDKIAKLNEILKSLKPNKKDIS